MALSSKRMHFIMYFTLPSIMNSFTARNFLDQVAISSYPATNQLIKKAATYCSHQHTYTHRHPTVIITVILPTTYRHHTLTIIPDVGEDIEEVVALGPPGGGLIPLLELIELKIGGAWGKGGGSEIGRSRCPNIAALSRLFR